MQQDSSWLRQRVTIILKILTESLSLNMLKRLKLEKPIFVKTFC
jgi:hypothetical protein